MKAVAAVVSILVLIVVGAVTISLIQGDSSPHDWEFDDYRVIDDVVSAEGSLELIDTYLGPTVHACAVGDGTITFSDGSVETVEVHRARLDVFFITGQSNSSYAAADPSKANPVPSLGESYAWMYENGRYGDLTDLDQAAMRPMVDASTGASTTGDKAPSFCATYNELTGNKVYWICGGASGQSIMQFDPDGGPVWEYMVELVNRAMDAVDRNLYEPVPCSFMWIQGESNKNLSVETYEKKFLNLVDAIIGGELGYQFNHCFVSLIKSDVGGNARIAQIKAAEEHPSTITIAADADSFTIENGLMASDDLHYSQLGDNIIGADLGKACAEFQLSRESSVNDTLLGMMPMLLFLAMAIMCIGLALRALMGRD